MKTPNAHRTKYGATATTTNTQDWSPLAHAVAHGGALTPVQHEKQLEVQTAAAQLCCGSPIAAQRSAGYSNREGSQPQRPMSAVVISEGTTGRTRSDKLAQG